jgi:hypothetical protein
MHLDPLQQPLQLVELQTVPPVHTPAVHVDPFKQVVHVAPLMPHDELFCALGCWHTPFAQHPVQLKKSHAVLGVHAPLMHELPLGQTLHACPLKPHTEAF